MKYFILKKMFFSKSDIISTINPNKKTVINEKTIEPIAPEIVFLGLILVSFFHLKIFPNVYPPTSEKMQISISQAYFFQFFIKTNNLKKFLSLNI